MYQKIVDAVPLLWFNYLKTAVIQTRWRSLEIFLADWWPIHRTEQVFEKLSSITIDIRTA